MRRRRPVQRFSPRLERLETRSMLSASPLAAALPPAIRNPGSSAPIAVGDSNGQLAVVVTTTWQPGRVDKAVVLTIYNYNSSTGEFSTGAQLGADIPASPAVTLAFGKLNNQGVPDLVVAGPDGHGSTAVELFTSVQDATGHWQFSHFRDATYNWETVAASAIAGGNSGNGAVPSDVFKQQFGPVQARQHNYFSLALTDVNGDNAPDVVLATSAQVGVLLASPVQNNGQVSYDYEPVPAAANPFMHVPFGLRQLGVANADSATPAHEMGHNFGRDDAGVASNSHPGSSGVGGNPANQAGTANNGQASGNAAAVLNDNLDPTRRRKYGDAAELIVADIDGDGQPDLVTLVGNEILYSQMSVSTSTSGAAGSSLVFAPLELIAVLSSGSSSPTPLTVLPGTVPALDGGATRSIFVVPGASPDGSPDLLAVIGNQAYVGIGSRDAATGALSFTWHVDGAADLILRKRPGRTKYADEALLLTDVNNDGQLDLITVVIYKHPDRASPTATVLAENVFADEGTI